jgi:hypothetical protein
MLPGLLKAICEPEAQGKRLRAFIAMRSRALEERDGDRMAMIRGILLRHRLWGTAIEDLGIISY